MKFKNQPEQFFSSDWSRQSAIPSHNQSELMHLLPSWQRYCCSAHVRVWHTLGSLSSHGLKDQRYLPKSVTVRTPILAHCLWPTNQAKTLYSYIYIYIFKLPVEKCTTVHVLTAKKLKKRIPIFIQDLFIRYTWVHSYYFLSKELYFNFIYNIHWLYEWIFLCFGGDFFLNQIFFMQVMNQSHIFLSYI